MKNMYIAGKMRGIKHYNFPAFDRAEAVVRRLGFNPISPAAMDRIFECWGTYPPKDWVPKPEDFRRMIRRDLNTIIDSCQAVYMLQGWEESLGATTEHALARFLGLQIFYE